MRRILLPLLAAALLIVTACGASGSSTDNATTSAATDPMTSQSAVDVASAASTSEGSTTDELTAGSATESMTSAVGAVPGMTITTAVDAAPGTTITTAASDFGEILFDGNQQAIYLFDKEASSTPECYDDCAAAWPPVLTTGAPVATGGIDGALLGTTARTDGTTQVTYAGHPLYYYVDEGPGEVKCHNVAGFGGLWLVITPTGAAAAV